MRHLSEKIKEQLVMIKRIRNYLSVCKRKLWGIAGFDILKNVNHDRYVKRCLLVYITRPFKMKEISNRHQNFWQTKELARLLGGFQYRVDVIDYQNPYTRPRGKYDLVIGLIPRDIDVYSIHLKKDAKKIAYLTSSNLEFSSKSEQERLDELYARRGVRLLPRRQGGAISKQIETFDGALFFGNDYNLRSYACFKMPPVYYIANNGYEYGFPIKYDKNPKKFLYFGSAGHVHKGLDLLLEIFSQESFPCELYVCGAIESETDFVAEYAKELYHTPNIHTMGFVDVYSSEFERLANECAFSILPSCAEGQAGSVVTSMSAGILSIVSKVCGYGPDEVILLPDCRKSTIQEYILKYSKADKTWLMEQSKLALQNARDKYSRQSFTKSVQDALTSILKE